MSSSYREPSTQIPSSDEYAPAQDNVHSKSAAATLLSLLNVKPSSGSNQTTSRPAPQPMDRMNKAEAMYSKHGHLAAPRPQPAPQQVERLLAMLQAPTPGPLPPTPNKDHDFTQTASATILNHNSHQPGRDIGHLGSDSDLEQKTPRYLDHHTFDPFVNGNGEHYGVASPRSGDTSVPINVHVPSAYPPTQSPNAYSTPIVRDLSMVGRNQLGNGTTSAEPITPRASNLLDMLIKGTAPSHPHTNSSQAVHPAPFSVSRTLGSNHISFAHCSPPPLKANSLMSSPSSVVPLKEAERREKQDALLKQLQSLARLGVQQTSIVVD